MPRPPSTWAWRWNTVWPPSALVLMTTRYPASPSPSPKNLEFDRALEAVAAYAVSGLGAESLRQRTPHDSPEWIESELACAAELQRVWEAGDEFAPENIPDIRASLETTTSYIGQST